MVVDKLFVVVKLIFFAFLCFSATDDLFGQQAGFRIPDSLKNRAYGDLYNCFMSNVDSIPEKAEVYAKTYLKKGLEEKNQLQTVWGYYLLAKLTKDDSKKSVVHLDSAINISSTLNDKYFPAILLIHKGVIKEMQGLFNEAINSYLLAIKFSKKSNNDDYLYITKHNIGLLKRKLGKYEEAKSIFKECLNYEEKKQIKKINDSVSYLITLSELIITYRFNNQIDSASIFNNHGIRYSKNQNGAYLFLLEEGIHDYHYKKYHTALQKITASIPEFFKAKNKDFFEDYNLIQAYLYLGKTYKALLNNESSIHYYQKVDSITQSTNDIIPENRIAYVELINYYKSLNDKESQLVYINKLLRMDSILNNDYKLINNRITKDYDTPELLEDKEKLIKVINTKNSNYKSIIVFLFVVIILVSVLFFNQYKKRKLYRKRFDILMKTQPNTIKKTEDKVFDVDDIGISKKIIEAISKKIDLFEKNKGFIQTNITTNNLAEKMETNPKYISKVVHHYKKKNFTYYINDLRIDYVLEKLKNDSKFRKYTIKAISREAGFNNTQSFSQAFYRKTGIYPSFFIKKLNSIKN